MYQDEPKSGMERFKDGLAVFLSRNAKLLVIGFGVVLLILAGLGIWSIRYNARVNDSAALAEQIEEDFSTWLNTEDGEKKEKKEEELLERIDRAQSQFSGLYAEQRALLVKGHYQYSLEEYQEAAEAYSNLVSRFPKSYLAPVALYNAGTCYDESGKNEQAVESWDRLVQQYRDKTPLMAQTFFSLGRISEEQGQEKKAVEYYQRMEDSYPESDWTKLAKQRILVLTVD